MTDFSSDPQLDGIDPDDEAGFPGGGARPCSDETATLGEGPRWDAERGELLWVDIPAGTVHRSRVGSDGDLITIRGYIVGHPVGAAHPAAAGGWLLCAGEGFWHLDEDGGLSQLAQPEADRGGATRMNDARTDPRGRLFAGSMAYDQTPGAGRLHRLDVDGSVTTVLDGLTISNGIDWSGDGATVYLADSGPGTVDRFDYDVDSGTFSGRRTIYRSPEDGVVPDGLVVDTDDTVWVAFHGGGVVRRLSPEGEVLAEVRLPAMLATAPCFGGPELSTLFVTTATEGLGEEELAAQPGAGRVLRLDGTGATGRPVVPYAGPVPGTAPAPRRRFGA